jgi:hypothetical protein
MLPKEKRGDKINAQFNTPPLAPVATINMTDPEQAKYKIGNETEHEINQTQATRKEETKEKETYKHTKITNKNQDEETQPRQLNDNKLSWGGNNNQE